MATTQFPPLLPATARRYPRNKTHPYLKVVKAIAGELHHLSLTTLLTLGATLQILICLFLPPLYAFIPTLSLLGYRIINTALITYNIIPNPYMKDKIEKKFSALPYTPEGEQTAPGGMKIAVLLLGAKSNHPLGNFAPKMAPFGELFTRMYLELGKDKDNDNGFLGISGWNRTDANGAIEQTTISYWRSLEDVHKYAHGPTHRSAVRWWNDNIKSLGHVGIFHEVFEAPAGMWEAVYGNFQPTLLGATSFRIPKEETYGQTAESTDDNKTQWISPIVEATTGPMRSSLGRRGLQNKREIVGDMFDTNVYVGLKY